MVPFTANVFKRAIVMPNLKPPVRSLAEADAYRQRILAGVPAGINFEPLMTLYLTDNTTPEEIKKAAASGIVAACKYYPAGATTNSADGVTSVSKVMGALEAMAEAGLPLLVHGEVTEASVDIFDREKRFVEGVLAPLLQRMPLLRVVLEHITTKDAVKFVESDTTGRLGATITPQHMLLNRNAMLVGGIRPHYYCLPILKREEHREAVHRAATSGDKRFFLGTDSAPHAKGMKECACGCAGCFSAHAALPLYAMAFEQAGALDKLEAFASFNGPDFYGRPRNSGTVTLSKAPWDVPSEYTFGDATVVPLMADTVMSWAVTDVSPGK